MTVEEGEISRASRRGGNVSRRLGMCLGPRRGCAGGSVEGIRCSAYFIKAEELMPHPDKGVPFVNLNECHGATLNAAFINAIWKGFSFQLAAELLKSFYNIPRNFWLSS